ncbi:hypothetical protein GGR54DRAFT_181070 [Hypoxylon sp. NC1633]|nr:hypothetical protein GGR54DRAFT_181070 [Hypoxylon sp. NC1633]
MAYIALSQQITRASYSSNQENSTQGSRSKFTWTRSNRRWLAVKDMPGAISTEKRGRSLLSWCRQRTGGTLSVSGIPVGCAQQQQQQQQARRRSGCVWLSCPGRHTRCSHSLYSIVLPTEISEYVPRLHFRRVTEAQRLAGDILILPSIHLPTHQPSVVRSDRLRASYISYPPIPTPTPPPDEMRAQPGEEIDLPRPSTLPTLP